MPLRALEGYIIGVTADRRAGEQTELLKRRGATVVHAPTIETSYLGCDDTLRAATNDLLAQPPDYVVATTGIGVRAWLEVAQSWALGDELLAALASARIVARGAKAAGVLQAAGLTVWQRPPSELLADVQRILMQEDLDGMRVAVQLYGEPAPEFVDALRAAGACVVEVPVYRWRLPENVRPVEALIDDICDRRVHAVTFTSAPAVRNLFAVAARSEKDGALREAFSDATVAACIGPVCAAAATLEGLGSVVAPDVGRLGLLVRKLSERLDLRRQVLDAGGINVTVQGTALTVNGQNVDLRQRERAVLSVLLRHPGSVVSRAELLREVWGLATTNPHVLEVTVARLRRGLGPIGHHLIAIPSRGYRLDALPSVVPDPTAGSPVFSRQ